MGLRHITRDLAPPYAWRKLTSVTFLHLPDHVRDQIYRGAGLFTGAVVSVQGSYDLPHGCPGTAEFANEPYTVYPRNSEVRIVPEALSCYRALRLVSHTVRLDTARFLYTHNEVVLRCTRGDELSILLNAPAHLIESIRHLTVLLRVSSPPFKGPGTCFNCDTCPHSWHQAQYPLLSTSDGFRGLIFLWKKLIDRIASSGKGSNLKLHVSCDVADLTTGVLVTEPLRQLDLAACTIRLGDSRNHVLEDLAFKTRLRSTGVREYAQRPFRFLDLPTEIRQHILAYTDLVTPFQEVEWALEPKGFRLPWAWCRPFPCASREFCSLRHAVSPPCTCWRPPTPLFLVCRQVLHDARAVFYSSNRFIVAPSVYPLIMPRNPSFEASVFLTNLLSQNAIHHLRTLEVAFMATAYNHDNWDADAWTGWAQTIKVVASRTQRLALRLYLGHGPPPPLDDVSYDGIRHAQKALFHVHEKIVEPFAQLDALDFLFLEVTSPYGPLHLDWRTVDDEIEQHHEHLRRLVMGDKPNNPMTEKSQRERSGWLSFPLEPEDFEEPRCTFPSEIRVQRAIRAAPALQSLSRGI